MAADSQKQLLKKAGTLLTRRAYSRGELRIKLSKLAGEPEVEAALNHLQQLNLLNDMDYAYNFALYRIKHDGWGAIKVHHALLHRHVAEELIDAAIARVRQEVTDEVALNGYLQRYCRKMGLPKDNKSIAKLIARLQRRGFHEQAIYPTLQRIIPASVWQRFETGE
jgi:SOS response regulatory protein OraA/RecX